MTAAGKGAIRLGATYIFSGYAKQNAAGTGLEPEPQSLAPVRHMVISTASRAVNAAPGSLALWKTDASGLLHPIGDSARSDVNHERAAAVHYWEDGAQFNVVPTQAILNSWAAHQENWPGKLKEFLEGKLRSTGVAFKEVAVRKRHLVPPNRASEDEDEIAYARTYDSLSDGSFPLAAILFPKMRAAVLLFTDPSFKGADVRLTSERGTVLGARAFVAPIAPGQPHEKTIDGLVCAVAFGTEETLPAGLYQIEVSPPDLPPTGWNPKFTNPAKYTLHEALGFDITTLAGDFDVVCCDPISVEETIMQQFPALFAHQLAGATKRVLHSEVAFPENEFPVALKPWAERLGWAHSKAKMVVSTINDIGKEPEKGGRPKLVGSAIWKALEPREDSLGKAAKSAIELYYDFKDAYKDGKELIQDLKLERSALKGVKELIWDDVEGLDRFRWWNFVKQSWRDEDRAVVFSLVKKGERSAILKAGIPQKRTNLQSLVGTKTGLGIEKTIAVTGTALAAVDLALAVNEVVVAKQKRDEHFHGFKKLIGKVDSVLHRGASREGIGNIERMRTATIASELGLEGAEGKALMAACDAVLGVLTMLGVGGPALGVVVWAKSTAGLVVDAAEYLDKWAFKGFVEELLANQKAMYRLAESSRVNQSLMPRDIKEGGRDDLHVQFLLRAEAVMGLVKLFTRASISVKESSSDQTKAPEKYLEQVKKYRIQEYVERFLLGDAWQFPLRPMIPIGMDSVWMYLTGKLSGLDTRQSLGETLGYVRPLKFAAASAIPHGMTMLAVVDRVLTSNVVANFHQTYPIHRMDSKSFEDLAMAFRTTWPEVEKDAVEYTCIYTRPAGSTDDAAWSPINRKGVTDPDDLDLLSPYDQLRVLVVLKERVKRGIYPLSFQLVRVDGLHVSGPIYRELTKTLADEELLGPEKAKGFAGRVGCVFYPFFRFQSQTIPGTKILAPGASWGGIYRLLGYLDDMRYSFELKLGSTGNGKKITIGGPGASTSKIKEYRVGITGKTDEDKLCEMSFLTREGQDFQYPKLPTMNAYVGPCYARVENGPWILASLEEGANRVFSSYDWRTPVELIVVAQAHQIRAQVWEEQGADWSRLPIDIQLVNFTGWDTLGPSYPSELEYVGSMGNALQKSRAAFESLDTLWQPSEIPDPSPGVSQWANEIRRSPTEMKKLDEALRSQESSANHVYAAHFSLNYYTPEGAPRDGLRPFGRILTNKPGKTDTFYRIGIRNVTTPPSIGIQASKIELHPLKTVWGDLPAREFEFHFAAPVEGQPYPWGQMNPHDARLTTWIEHESTVADPRVRLLKNEK